MPSMWFLAPLVLFGLFWTAIVGVADVMIGSSMLSSLQALSFERTSGTITHSEVVRHEDSDGDTYSVDIRFTYLVDGNRHEGTRYSYSVVSSSERMWADRIVGEHPVGSTRDVRYSRHEPSDSVLNPGIDGSTLMMLMFLTPFNAVMVGIWSFVGLAIFWLRHNGARSPLPTFRRAGATHIRLSHLTWPVVGVIGVGGASVVGIFLIGFGTGFHPEVDQMVVCWIIVLLVGVHVALGRRRQERAGCFDFIVDERFVSFPRLRANPRGCSCASRTWQTSK
jgi:hypothetical protein